MTLCTNCAAELAEGEVNNCYVCDKATPLEYNRRHAHFLPGQNPPPVKHPHINLLDTLPSTAERKLQIGLSSGRLLTPGKVMLFPELEVRAFLALKAKAQQEMGGFSTGLGFWGSPEWAIGGAAALGFIESLVSGAKARQGMKTLSEAAKSQTTMRSLGSFFDVCQVASIWQPDPFVWRAVKADTGNDDIEHIHNGDDSIWVEQEGCSIAIRWASVESYNLI